MIVEFLGIDLFAVKKMAQLKYRSCGLLWLLRIDLMRFYLLGRIVWLLFFVLFLRVIEGENFVVWAKGFTHFCSSPQGEYQWDARVYRSKSRFGHYFSLELSNKKVFRFQFIGPRPINFAWLAPDGGIYPFNIQLNKKEGGFGIYSVTYPSEAGFVCRKRY